MRERKDLVWQTIIGFVGFFALISLVQAVINVLRPDPLIWPGVLAGVLLLATWLLVRRWLQWREEN
ncbi:hypothetical protein QP027_02280 [Corynebacterium breve]|uniref:Uncharacterized protein n=1 Tax=Corynebacterium breve TaxID=3049799 RepID=A0ABY8VF36_9CORY|nr:hypothetical protein [Corynebacterium breve]WIM68250.1 hypothetical protein QP027_02280 [Corynebacterium breve]